MTWWIKAWNSAGYSPWSNSMTFYTALPGIPTTVSPAGSSSTGNPTYTWNAVADSTYYQLYVDQLGGGSTISTWYSSSQANCIPNGQCNVTPATTVSGNIGWWVRSHNKVGNSAWSSPTATFTAP